MSKLSWDTSGTHYYEIGVDRGVLYITGSPGVAWNGLISVNETPEGGDVESVYHDGVMVRQSPRFEDYHASISAYQRPVEFGPCEGIATGLNGMFVTQQRKVPFGMSYRTIVGNDIDGNAHGYKIHLIYNAMVKPSQRSYRTLDGSVNPAPYLYDVSAIPALVDGYRSTAHLIIDSLTSPPDLLSDLEDILYGTDDDDPRLPTPEEVFVLGYGFIVIDHGDGTFTVKASDSMLTMLDADTFQIDSPTAIFLSSDTYTLSSI